jgi:DNA-binding CsgD family transcriptional regulator
MDPMHELTQQDYRDGWRLVCEMSDAAGSAVSFAQHGTLEIPRLVASEITTLSVCDLGRNVRSVVGTPAGAISAADRETFDRHFAEHPLVRYHAGHPQGRSHRISDSLSRAEFRESALYNEYYRRIGIDHVIAVPLFVDQRLLVSFVLNRNGLDFSDRDCALLDLVREPLSALYRHTLAMQRARTPDGFAALPPSGFAALPITPREREVLSWLAGGKTDREIAEILGMSPRTVQKHLQHIYEKLGVETRTAAVMRAMEISARSGGVEAG